MENLAQHLEWMQDISRRLENAYSVLCEYEEHHNALLEDSEEKLKLFQLLETVAQMHKSAQTIRTIENDEKSKQTKMRLQMQMLQNSLEVLELESKTKAVKLT